MSTQPQSSPIDFNSILTASLRGAVPASQQIPTDSSGMVSVWDLPSYMLSTNGHKAPVLWYDTGHKTDTVHQPGPGEHSGPGMDVNQVHSFDINATPEQIMKNFAAMSQEQPDQFRALQKQLADAGYFGSASNVYGGWNKQTEAALRDAMIQYLKVSQGAGAAVSFTQFLQNSSAENAANGATGAGGGGSSASVPHPTLTDPDQLKLYAQKAAQSELGRNLSEGELNRFVNNFHQQQVNAFNVAQSGTGNVVEKTDPSASAIDYVQQNNKQEFATHQVQGYADAFLNMFLSGPDAAPNVNVDQSAAGV